MLVGANRDGSHGPGPVSIPQTGRYEPHGLQPCGSVRVCLSDECRMCPSVKNYRYTILGTCIVVLASRVLRGHQGEDETLRGAVCTTCEDPSCSAGGRHVRGSLDDQISVQEVRSNCWTICLTSWSDMAKTWAMPCHAGQARSPSL